MTPKNHKVLEILSEEKVVVHMNFVLPAYFSDLIHVSKDRKLMIQMLTGDKTFLYRAITENSQEPKKIRWELVRKIDDYLSFYEYAH